MPKIILFLTAALFPFFIRAQNTILSGVVKDAKTKTTIPYASLVLKSDHKFVIGTISAEDGRFKLTAVQPGTYTLEISYMGYVTKRQEVVTGTLSPYLDLGTIELPEDAKALNEVMISGKKEDGLSDKMDKKSFAVGNNISQLGGSVLQTLQNLPGVTVHDGKIQLRGSDKVAVLIDGRQNAMTGFGSQTSLDNIPASAIERIEIINNPSSKFDANGNAGIINIIYKKEKQEGFNGKIGLSSGLGALWQRKENLPGIGDQYQATPKLNPSLSMNYRKNKVNTFLQADWLYTQTLNRNEFAERYYDDGSIIRQQVKRNRTTTFATVKTGADWTPDEQNTFTFSVFLNREGIKDLGEIPYYNADLSERQRLWKFLEDEVKYTATGFVLYQHQFKEPGHLLNAAFNYTFHREDEKYFFTNIMPSFTGEDAFKLLSDEHVADLTIDYIKPLKYGKLETGAKFRRRLIPTDMQFFPGLNSPIDVHSGGWADYKETIPAIYGNYIFENKNFELEAGIRLEYVKVRYEINPDHNTYKSDGYDYTRPFPNLRLAYKLNQWNKFSLSYNQRVDRPNEVDIRIFPKYDDPEVIKVGNPGLKPQFTSSLDLGYKLSWRTGHFYTALYHKITNATITRITTAVPGSTLLYSVFQNAGKSTAAGTEVMLHQEITPWFSLNANAALYRNTVHAFTVENKYPVSVFYSAPTESITSGNIKINQTFKLPRLTELQLSGVYLAPDLIPQGKIGSRFSIDLGAKKAVQNGKGELFINANDLFNTLRIKREIQGNNFKLNSIDYYETQVVRIGYSYKF